MIAHLAASSSTRHVTLLHADASLTTFALQHQVRTDLAQLPGATLSAWFSTPDNDLPASDTPDATSPMVPIRQLSGLMDLAETDLPTTAQYYLCGPLGFMQMVRSALILRGTPAQDIQYEVFGPDLWLAEFESVEPLPTAL